VRSQVSAGYLTANGEFISPGPWNVCLADGGQSKDGRLPNWDYFTDVLVTRTVDVDLPAVLTQIGLSDDAQLSATVLWHSTGTNLRGACQPVRLNGSIAELTVRLPGGELGGRLILEMRIILSCQGSSDQALAPHRPGNVVWSDSHQVELEGSGSRFPVVPLNFAQTGIGGGRRGAWCLVVSGEDLTASALGNIRLYLNTAHPRTESALKFPDAESSQLYFGMIRYDVARQLLQYALRREDFSMDDDYEPESIGHVLQQLVALLPQSLHAIRTRLAEDPGELEAEFQAKTGLVD
jgi:hypothetical protein